MATANFRSSIVKTMLRVHHGHPAHLVVKGASVTLECATAKTLPVSKIGPFYDCKLVLDRDRLAELSHKRPEVKITFDKMGATLS